MGIEGLLQYIRKNHPSAHLKLPISQFKGKRMAVDISGILYRQMHSSRKKGIDMMNLEEGYDENLIRKMWYGQIIHTLCNMLSADVLPVIVFDGKGPELKAGERESRMKKAKQKREEIAEARRQLDECLPFDKPQMIENLRNAYKNTIDISSQDHELIKIVLGGSGLPCIQAAQEADDLCSMLCYYGVVAASFSADSDLLCHGSPLLVTNFMTSEEMKKEGITEKTVVAYHLGYLLESMQMSFASFVDFCILSICDYNRIDGSGVRKKIAGFGQVKIEQMIKKYKYIEDIPEFELKKIAKDGNIDLSIYKHIECRERFSQVPLEDLIVEFIQKEEEESDEEYSDEENNSIAGLKITNKDKQEMKETNRLNLFGDRKDRYQLVSNSDIRSVFTLVNIPELADKMKSCIWRFLERNNDSGEEGHIPFTYVPKKHVWNSKGELYIDGKLFETFK